MQFTQFPPGNYYMIINKATQQALRIQQNDPTKYEKSKVIGVKPNPQDSPQLFMVEKIGAKQDQIEIVNCISTYVLDEESTDIKVRYGKQGKDQLFSVVAAPNSQGYYRNFWIRTDSKGSKALSLIDRVLKVTSYNPNDPMQLFRFQQVNSDRNNILSGSAIIVNNYSGKVIDVPKASRKEGEKMVQWTKNKRWNQRWSFIKQKNGIAIRSVVTGHNLDICGQSKKNGADIIQWRSTGGTNQQWMPQPCGNGLYKFWSIHEPSLFLAIRKQSKEDGQQLQVCSTENPSMYWRIQGCMPPH